MDIINRQSKTSSFFSIAWVIAGPWQPDKGPFLDFQRALLDNGLEFAQTITRPNGYQLRRDAAVSALNVTLESPAAQVHSLQVVAPNPGYDLDLFCRDADAVASAYRTTWPHDQIQLLSSTGKIHHLYSASEHSFKYLWETRLNQSPDDFKRLGHRPVSGGGLRLVMPPHSIEGAEPVSIEVRIESFLREPNKLLIETAFTWPRPRTVAADDRFDPAAYMQQVEAFAANDVWEFIQIQ